jgi:hypothetical protein
MSATSNPLKYWTDSIMDQFSDALLNMADVPHAQELLATELIRTLLTKVSTVNGSTMTEGQMASDLTLMGKTLNEQPNCDAVILFRVMKDGSITTGGASRNMRDNATAEMAEVAKRAIYALRELQEGSCPCPKCQAKRAAQASGVFNGPKAEC